MSALHIDRLVLPNTLGLPAVSQHGAIISSVAQLIEAVELAAQQEQPLQVLGSGSNVVLPRALGGITLLMRIPGIESVERVGESVRLEVGAGESWQGFVRFCIGQGLGGGIENLTLIPGTVGAAPIQNIGAYGVEVAEFIEAVEVIDRRPATRGAAFKPRWIPANECAFGYRDSSFKQQPDRWIVSRVRFLVSTKGLPRVDYAGITEELERMGINVAASVLKPVVIAEAVARTRRRKLPDPRQHPNAGSFFKNPVLTRKRYEELVARGRSTLALIPHWAQGRHIKLSAAALIDQAGWKSQPSAQVMVWRRQPLVLVNRGNADAADITRYAKSIQRSVLDRFDIQLEQEPQRLT